MNNSDKIMILLGLTMAITLSGVILINVHVVYGLLTLCVLPLWLLVKIKRVENWLFPYERIIPDGSELLLSECDKQKVNNEN